MTPDAPDAAVLPDFEVPDLARQVEQLTQDCIDRLPYGAILLDRNGIVTFYSKAERRLSGYRKDTLGIGFFTEIAPCMNTPEFRGRVERALAAGRLDLDFDHIGDFDDETKELRVRVQSAANGGCWIFMRREG